jgi:F420H(2)-dependent quinone reductase
MAFLPTRFNKDSPNGGCNLERPMYHELIKVGRIKYMAMIFIALHVWLYRISSGKLGGSMNGFNVLLLTTKGRKSGKDRTVPLGAFEQQGGYVVVASNGGGPNNPAWFYNLKSNPSVTIQVLDKVIPVSAEVLSGEARAQAWKRVITTAPGYAGYEKKTRREIPLILLLPTK